MVSNNHPPYWHHSSDSQSYFDLLIYVLHLSTDILVVVISSLWYLLLIVYGGEGGELIVNLRGRTRGEKYIDCDCLSYIEDHIHVCMPEYWRRLSFIDITNGDTSHYVDFNTWSCTIFNGLVYYEKTEIVECMFIHDP